MIEVKSLRQRFGRFVLGRLDLRVERGSYMVILGPSGCGKSLLLGAVAGLFRPDQGRIMIGEREVTGLPPEERRIGLVFQEPALFPHFNVDGNIAFGLKARGMGAAEVRARLAELDSSLSLDEIRRRPVASLSGGEAQKVALARALAIRPDVLLLDEPLSQVDHNGRTDLITELKRIQKQLGLTTIHVTHNREEARVLADCCAIMLGGRMIQTGSSAEVFERPLCLFVARFLGDQGGGGRLPNPPGCSESCLAGTGRCDRADETRPGQPEGCGGH